MLPTTASLPVNVKNVNHIGDEVEELQMKHMCLELCKGKPVRAGMPTQVPTLSQM